LAGARSGNGPPFPAAQAAAFRLGRVFTVPGSSLEFRPPGACRTPDIRSDVPFAHRVKAATSWQSLWP